MSTAQNSSPTRRRSLAGQAAAAGAAATLLVVCLAGSASADESGGSTVGNVQVDSSIVLSGLTSSFLLTGIADSTASENGIVEFTVETNNLAGYAVTVQSQSATLDPAAAANTDAIPIGALSVRETGTTAFQALSDLGTVTVHTQSVRSVEDGDLLSNDYSVDIPFVNEDTYSATLDYIASTL